MFTLPVFVSLAIASLATAQSSNTALELAAIKAHFQAAGLVPSFLSTFDPSAILTIAYAGGVGSVSPGQLLTPPQVGSAPTLTITPANSSATTTGNYTIAMIDAGPVGTNQAGGQTRHWLVNGATITGASVSSDSAVVITDYAGPGPAPGSGPHRYVVLVYSQPAAFTPPAGLDAPGVPVGSINFPDYVRTSNLGPLLAANYITVEDGTATASLSPTSAVITSTLAVPSGSSSRSAGASSTNAAARPSQSSSGATSLRATGCLTVVFAAALMVIFN